MLNLYKKNSKLYSKMVCTCLFRHTMNTYWHRSALTTSLHGVLQIHNIPESCNFTVVLRISSGKSCMLIIQSKTCKGKTLDIPVKVNNGNVWNDGWVNILRQTWLHTCIHPMYKPSHYNHWFGTQSVWYKFLEFTFSKSPTFAVHK